MVSARLAIEVHLNVHENPGRGEWRAKCRFCLNESGWGLRVSVSNKPTGAGAYAAGRQSAQTWGSKTIAYLILMCPHSPLSHVMGTETLVVSILF